MTAKEPKRTSKKNLQVMTTKEPKADNLDLFCVGCGRLTEARLTTGAEIYPHRPDLADLPFWKCDVCKNYVGCHHKTANPTKPLGVIPTPELKKARMAIHAKLDPLWRQGNWNRKNLYAHLNAKLGYSYHTADIRSLKQAQEVLIALNDLLTDSPDTSKRQAEAHRKSTREPKEEVI